LLEESNELQVKKLVGLCALGFLTLASYSVARPAIESLFLESYTETGLPWVWIAVAVTAFFTVLIYNRFASRLPPMTLYGAAVAASIIVLEILLFLRQIGVPGSNFLLYVWKDIYIVILVEIFWTYANCLFRIRTARWLYGLLLVVGTAGSITGNLGVGWIADTYGTELALWTLFPLLGLVWWMSQRMALDLPTTANPPTESRPMGEGLRAVRDSRYLIYMVLLIAVVQVVINLIDYQYNSMLEESYPDVDDRTKMNGRIYTFIDMGSLGLQFLTAVILTRLGVGRTLLAIPAMLGIVVGAFAASPRFLTAAMAKIGSKCFDYSLFRAAKEILYIPLGYREKTQGKAVVDMLTYRVAKGTTSILVLGILALGSKGVLSFISILCFVLIAVWVLLIRSLVAQYRKRKENAPAE
tara:strand:- start:2633 stop:3868 length:1236 start_codon:yes stop_codon:yes gene_type:complete